MIVDHASVDFPGAAVDATIPRMDPLRAPPPPCPPEREVFTNRTLNLRAIRGIGYDMDYTLIHYKVEAWERRAYEHLQRKLVEHGWQMVSRPDE